MTLAVVLATGPTGQARAAPADAAAAAGSPSGAAATPGTMSCDLKTCFDRAMQRSPLIAAARTDIEKYEAKLREAKSAMYPRFEISGFFSILPEKKPGASGENPFEDWDWTQIGPLVTTQLTVAQVLYTFGKIDTLKKMARKGVSISRTLQQYARMEMHYQVSRAWWGLVMSEELQDIIDTGEKKLIEERERIEELQDADKDFNPSDLLRLRMLEADFEKRAREARRARALAMDALVMAMDAPVGTEVKPVHQGLVAVTLEPRPSAHYEALALANHPKLVALRGGTMVRAWELALAKKGLLPDVLLTGRVAYTYVPTRDLGSEESIAANPTNPTQSGAGIAVRWPLDIFRQMARIDAAEVAHRKASLDERGEMQKIVLSIRKLHREMVDAGHMVGVYERAMKAARGWLRAESEMHEGGFQEYEEVLKAIEQYYRRRLDWLRGVYDYNVAVAAMSRAVGTDITLARPDAAALKTAARTPQDAQPTAGPSNAKEAAKPAPPAAAAEGSKAADGDDDEF